MSFKVLVTLAVVLFAYCTASTVPEASDPVPQPQDPITLPQPQEPTTSPLPTTNQVQGTNIQQCAETTDQGFGGTIR